MNYKNLRWSIITLAVIGGLKRLQLGREQLGH